mmetsp:Transcript_1919/g.6900  ORF Transcript_1919/g.6900 Transcript_1919/m.6900 type:complete len:237 (-) Transcript_1919:99-809(-)
MTSVMASCHLNKFSSIDCCTKFIPPSCVLLLFVLLLLFIFPPPIPIKLFSKISAKLSFIDSPSWFKSNDSKLFASPTSGFPHLSMFFKSTLNSFPSSCHSNDACSPSLNALKASRSINFVVSFIAISVARIAFSIALDAGYKTAEMVPKPNIIAKAIGTLLLFKIGTLVGDAIVVAVFVREAAAETDETSFIMVLLFFIDGGDKVRNGKSVWVVVFLVVFVTTRERRRKRRFRKQL